MLPFKPERFIAVARVSCYITDLDFLENAERHTNTCSVKSPTLSAEVSYPLHRTPGDCKDDVSGFDARLFSKNV